MITSPTSGTGFTIIAPTLAISAPVVGGLYAGNGDVTNSLIDLQSALSVTGDYQSDVDYRIALVGGAVFGNGTAGGLAEDAGNTVRVGVSVTGGVLGGLVSGNGEAVGNKIYITGDASVGDTSYPYYIVGGSVSDLNGFGTGDDKAYGNSVNIDTTGTFDGSVEFGNIFGALVVKGSAGYLDEQNKYGNTVTIDNGDFGTDVYILGAMVEQGSALFNKIAINGGTFDDAVIRGGRVMAEIGATASTVLENSVTIQGDDVSITSAAILIGGVLIEANNANSEVKGNTVSITVSGSSAYNIGQIVGGEITKINTDVTPVIDPNPTLSLLAPSVSGNTVTISGSGTQTVTASEIIGGAIEDATSYHGTLSDNAVNVNNVTVTGDVYGALVTDGGSSDVTASGNKVNLTGATIGGDIYGAYDKSTSLSIGDSNAVNFISGTNEVAGNIAAAGALTVSGGTNNIGTGGSKTVAADSLTIAGASTNTFFGATTVENDASFSGGSETTFQDNFTDSNGNIDISGGAKVILDGGAIFITAGAGDITIGNGSELRIETTTATNDIIVSGAGKKISVANGGTLSVSADRAALFNSDLSLANGAILSFGWDGSDLGSITVDAGKTISVEPNGTVVVNIDASSPILAPTMVLTTAVGTFDLDNFYSLYALSLGGSSNELLVGAKLSLAESLEVNGTKAGLKANPNYVNAAILFDEIEASATNPDLIAALGDFVTNGFATLPDPELAFKQLIGESLVNVTSAVSQTTLKAQGLVYGRLDRIRELEGITPPAAGGAYAPSAGDGGELNRVWVGTFGVWTDVSDRDYVFGYDYKTTGFAMGYDRVVESVPGLRLGISTAFSYGTMDTNDSATTIDIDTAGIGVYASYLTSVGIFVDGSISYARAKNDYDTTFIYGSRKSGSFDIDSWQFGARVGAVLKANNFQFIPSVGVRFLTFDQEGWAEAISDPTLAPLANRFDGLKDHQVDIPIQLKINTTIESGSMKFVPELRLGWTIAAKRADDSLRVGFVGSPERAEISGVKPARNAFNAGLGFKLVTGSGADIFLNYDYEGASGFKDHQVGVGIGYEF
ncbi:MAG: autotransporter domain-containing protein [Deltaproteobacteria bacterium]|nr:autotransporter domain-containing protein [Deltaproteobacteria bacterium]